MIAFFDTSVFLRTLFRERDAFDGWKKVSKLYCSRMLELEVLRVVDRQRLLGDLDDESVALCREGLDRFLADAHVLAVTEKILRAAQAPFPTVVRSLDAIHLASALAIRERESELVFVSHDRQQRLAARSLGLPLV